MNKNFSFNKWLLIVYALIYGTIVTALTLYLKVFPTFIQMEYAIYDPLQKWTTVESGQQISVFESLFLINLDDAFFDNGTGQVKREKLIELLDFLGAHTYPKAIFLDYLFISNGKDFEPNAVDSLLIQKMKDFGDKLILPYRIKKNTIDLENKDIKFQLRKKEELLYTPKLTGYANPYNLIGDDNYRYCLLNNKDTIHSIVHTLLEVSNPINFESITQRTPSLFEINYLLDGNSPNFQLISIDNASDLIHGSINQLRLASGDHEKIFFIGLFDEQKDIYGLPIDSFKTPVNHQMNGIYIILNAYFNVITNTFLRGAEWGLIFLLNFILSFLGGCYFFKIKNLSNKNNLTLILELILSFLFFLILICGLYLYCNVKFPFVITTLFFVKNQYFFLLFQKLIIKIKKT